MKCIVPLASTKYGVLLTVCWSWGKGKIIEDMDSAVALTSCCSLLKSKPGRKLQWSLTSCWSWDEIVFLYVTWETSLTDCWPQDKVRWNIRKERIPNATHTLLVIVWECLWEMASVTHILLLMNWEMMSLWKSALLLTFWCTYKHGIGHHDHETAWKQIVHYYSHTVWGMWWDFLVVCSVTYILFIIWCGEILQ